MSIPAYLDSSVYPFNYVEKLGLVDVDDGVTGAITTTRAQIVGGSLNWSEPSTALFKTPVDSAGRFLDVLVTRISSTIVEFRVRNQAGTTVCTRRLQLGTGVMRIFASSAGLVIEMVQTNPVASEMFAAFLLDMAPDTTSDHSLYVVGAGHRNNTSTVDSQGGTTGQYFAIDNGVAGELSRNGLYMFNCNSNAINSVDSTGRYFFRELLFSINFAGTVKWAGRAAHALWSDSIFNGGDERKIYIDTNTVATFKCVGQVNFSNQRGPWMRKS